jgi:hypothetical protein
MITDGMRSIIGATLETRVAYPVSASDIRRWALAVYYPAEPPRHFWDEQYALASPFGGIVAPAEFNAFAWGARLRTQAVNEGVENQSDVGTPERCIGVQPPVFMHLLNGGVEHVYESIYVRPGDVITSTSAIVKYDEREGRLGLMLFTTIESRLVNQNKERVSTERLTLIRY